MCELVRIRTNDNRWVKVASVKRDCITGIIRAAKECDYIEQIIVFGSSVEKRCKKSSDIDMAVISNVTGSKLYRTASYRRFKESLYSIKEGQLFDVLQFNSRKEVEKSNDQVCRDILNKGMLIYQRSTTDV